MQYSRNQSPSPNRYRLLQQSKYRAEPTIIDGIRFSSKGEARRYQDLKLLEQAGEISDLKLQPKFEIKINGIKVCSYIADFKYKENGKEVIEDFKGVKTPSYNLKKKLMKAVFNIEVVETTLKNISKR